MPIRRKMNVRNLTHHYDYLSGCVRIIKNCCFVTRTDKCDRSHGGHVISHDARGLGGAGQWENANGTLRQ